MYRRSPTALVQALMFAALGAFPAGPTPLKPRVLPPSRRGKSVLRSLVRRYGGRLPHDGKQEQARRRAQIERGQLTGSNGLVVRRRDE